LQEIINADPVSADFLTTRPRYWLEVFAAGAPAEARLAFAAFCCRSAPARSADALSTFTGVPMRFTDCLLILRSRRLVM
jgi:hypothetical protein